MDCYKGTDNVERLYDKSNQKIGNSEAAEQNYGRRTKRRSPQYGDQHQRVSQNGNDHQRRIYRAVYDNNSLGTRWLVYTVWIILQLWRIIFCEVGIVQHFSNWSSSGPAPAQFKMVVLFQSAQIQHIGNSLLLPSVNNTRPVSWISSTYTMILLWV